MVKNSSKVDTNINIKQMSKSFFVKKVIKVHIFTKSPKYNLQLCQRHEIRQKKSSQVTLKIQGRENSTKFHENSIFYLKIKCHKLTPSKNIILADNCCSVGYTDFQIFVLHLSVDSPQICMESCM